MNLNDTRSLITTKEVFDSNGNFLRNERGEAIGKELLERKMFLLHQEDFKLYLIIM